MAVSSVIQYDISTIETLTNGVSGVLSPQVKHDAINARVAFSATTTPAATQVWSGTVTLVAGTKSLDLTALSGIGGLAQDFTGLKLRACGWHAPSANTGDITIRPHATNGYPLLGTDGATTGRKVVRPKGRGCFTEETDAAAVSASAKVIEFVGTGSETINLHLVFG